jgi:hypothetical protein
MEFYVVVVVVVDFDYDDVRYFYLNLMNDDFLQYNILNKKKEINDEKIF